jgi:hypothetical protein
MIKYPSGMGPNFGRSPGFKQMAHPMGGAIKNMSGASALFGDRFAGMQFQPGDVRKQLADKIMQKFGRIAPPPGYRGDGRPGFNPQIAQMMGHLRNQFNPGQRQLPWNQNIGGFSGPISPHPGGKQPTPDSGELVPGGLPGVMVDSNTGQQFYTTGGVTYTLSPDGRWIPVKQHGSQGGSGTPVM